MQQRAHVNPQFSAIVVALFLVALSQPAFAQDHPDVNAIVANMVAAQQQNRARIKPYQVTRTYKVFGANAEKPRSEVVAKVEVKPPSEKSYSIQQSTGGTAENVVRKALDKEMEVSKNPGITEVNDTNYDFSWAGRESLNGQDCFVLNISPKIDRKELLHGKIWVDASKYLIRRVEGEPSKSPSFWVRSLHLVFTFAEVSGMWLQISTEANANVRIAGAFRLTSNDKVHSHEVIAENTRPAEARAAVYAEPVAYSRGRARAARP